MPVSNNSRRFNRPLVGKPRPRIILGVRKTNNPRIRLTGSNVLVITNNDVPGHRSNKIVCVYCTRVTGLTTGVQTIAVCEQVS